MTRRACGTRCAPRSTGPAVADPFPLPDGWRASGAHWHAYAYAYRAGDAQPLDIPADRWQRLQRRPDAVLRNPDEVATWIEARTVEHGEKRQVWSIAEQAWIAIGDADDLAHLFGEHIVIAARGDSIYTDVFNSHRDIELFVEAVTTDGCDQH